MAGATSEAAALACRAKMEAAGIGEVCIRTFLAQHAVVSRGETGEILERDITPVDHLVHLNELPQPAGDLSEVLHQTAVLKLNGGLGTSMGLHTAKSLLTVKDGLTFLDFTALQIEHLRTTVSPGLRFMLMNSFSTSDDTRAFLQKYPALGEKFEAEVELMQNRVPKIRQDTFFPAEHSANPLSEWAPPGHGDLYAALSGTGRLEQLLREGYRYLFVSNSDNLGATLDLRLLQHFSEKKFDFLMEVCERTESDKKGGHLARRGDKLLLRESAQCAKGDVGDFQDIRKHRYFNTNNLWINLQSLKDLTAANDGVIHLPVIRNAKTVDPTDDTTTKVFQLETAMGAAIESFPHTTAIVVPRERFAPVKTCADLVALRSDAYVVTPDFRLVLDARRGGTPPMVNLDGKLYKLIQGVEGMLLKDGVPSLVECQSLTITGPVSFGKGVVVKGSVTIDNPDATHVKRVEGTTLAG